MNTIEFFPLTPGQVLEARTVKPGEGFRGRLVIQPDLVHATAKRYDLSLEQASHAIAVTTNRGRDRDGYFDCDGNCDGADVVPYEMPATAPSVWPIEEPPQ